MTRWFHLLPLVLGCSHADHQHVHDHGHQDGFHHRFDDAEKWSAVFDAPERDAWQMPGEVVAKMDVRPGHAVADIGAGTGYFLPYLSRAVGEAGRVIALDVEPKLVEHMTNRIAAEGLTNVTARVVEPNEPGLDDVDRILIVNTWHHIDQRVDYAKKLGAALKPGGAVVVVDYTKDAPNGPPREHRLEPQQVVDELTAAGLGATIVASALPRQYIVVGRRQN